MTVPPPLTRPPIRKQQSNSDLEHSWDILSLMTSDLGLVMGLKVADKFTSRTRNSVMLRNKRPFSEETTSRPLLVWLIQS